jgi:hypothetical protein
MALLRFLFLFTLIFSVARAEDPICQNQSDLHSQAADLFVTSCVPTCTAVFKINNDKAKNYFEKNCRAFSADETRPVSLHDIGKNVGATLDKALLQCLPQAGKKAVVGAYEFVKALPQIVSYLLSGGDGGAKNSGPSRSEQWAACAQSSECRRAVARNTLRFQEMNPDKTYKVSDAEVDAAISRLSFNQLFVQAEHDQQLSQNECLRYLSITRNKISSDGEEWTPARHQKVFDTLSQEHPHCPGVLKLLPPRLTADDDTSAQSQSQCLKTNPQPVQCLSLQEKIAVGTVCLGRDFSAEWDKMQVEFCSDVVQVVVPLPLIGPQTQFLPTLAKAEGAVSAGAAIEGAQVLKTAATETKSASSEIASASPSLSTHTSSVAGKAKVTIPRTPELQSFLSQYKDSVFVSEAQNRRYIALAENSAKTAAENKTRFFDVENSVMKKLNDSTNDKDLVTSLTNFQKETFLKNIDGLRAKYPGLQFELYSDFKSVKIAIQGQDGLSPEVNAQLLKDLNQVYLNSNKEFAAEVKKLGLSVPDAGEPEKWFRAGYGRSVDEAALAARRARQVDGDARVLDYSSAEVRGQMSQRLTQVEQSRVALSQSPSMQPLLEKSPQGSLIPRQDVFDLVRKNEDPRNLASAISSRYKIAFSADDAKQLQTYVKGVDEFSPAILIAKRETVGLDTATAGGASADFLGLGSANLKATAEGIAAKPTLEQALAGARSGEQNVTQAFKARMDQFKKTVGGEVMCSGDDCVRLSSAALSESEKTKILADLAKNPDTRNVRMSFIGPGVAPEARMQLASHGESIEKAFRKELEGHVSYDKLQAMTFGFDMQTSTLNQGTVNLVIGKTGATRLSVQDQIEMQKAFSRALEKYNQDLRTYTQGSSRTSETTLRLLPGPGLLGLPATSPDPK